MKRIEVTKEKENNRFKYHISEQLLFQKYIIDKESTYYIAKELETSRSTITRNLKKYKIRRQDYYKIFTKEFLVNQYIINQKSLFRIATESNSCISVVFRKLKEFNIKSRSKKQAQINISRNKGTNNSQYIDGRYSKIYYCKELTCSNKVIYDTWRKGNGRCIVCSKRGKLSSQWNNGSSFEPYPSQWTKIFKAQIRNRDNHKCQICGCSEAKCRRKLNVHHIDYDKANIEPDNLTSLCNACHGRTNGNRNYWKNLFRKKILCV